MISVEEAENLIATHIADWGTERIHINESLGRILAENLISDRDLPPFDRALVDGIAISYSDNSKFKSVGIQAAGQAPLHATEKDECVEIMTGAAVASSFDTVVRYEDLEHDKNQFSVQTAVQKGQNIHYKGSDKKCGEILVLKDQKITPAIMGIAASAGKTSVDVYTLPKVMIISTGDEIVPFDQQPNEFQIRSSNSITIQNVLKYWHIQAGVSHLKDDENELRTYLKKFLEDYDVLLLSGGVSMGKFDYLPKILKELGVEKVFHKIRQKPGKPFWFGSFVNTKIFAFPGNPVSVFLCLHRYFLPWLSACLKIKFPIHSYAKLNEEIHFSADLQYFPQVQVINEKDGNVYAEVIKTNGSGDFSHLAETQAFLELPAEKSVFKKDEVYKIWKYNS